MSKHGEGLCLMAYEDQVTGEIEMIWNSRDGVTPYIITSLAGNEARHISWKSDAFASDHVPKVGDRVFVDLTKERALEYRTRYVATYWDARMQSHFPGKTPPEVVEILAAGDLELGGGGQPDMIVVDRAWLDQLFVDRIRKSVEGDKEAAALLDRVEVEGQYPDG